jgi:hypothetical protein
MPFPVASSLFTKISALVTGNGVQAVPWNAVVYIVLVVIISGQIGPNLQGKIA